MEANQAAPIEHNTVWKAHHDEEKESVVLEQVWLGNMRHNITVKEIEDYIKANKEMPGVPEQGFVGNLRHNIDEETIREYIASLGHFDDFTVRLGPPRGQLKDAFCFVEFTQMSHVLALKAFLNGRDVSIRKCMPNLYSQCEN